MVVLFIAMIEGVDANAESNSDHDNLDNRIFNYFETKYGQAC